MKIISAITTATLYISITLLVLLSTIFVLLSGGVKISHLNFRGLFIEQLYIKFDNKLIVDIKKLDIPLTIKKKEKSSKESIVNLVKSFPLIEKNFKFVNLEELKVGDSNMKLLYKEDTFYIDNDLLRVDLKFNLTKVGFFTKILELNLKDFDLSANGEALLNLADERYNFKGFFKTHEIEGDAEIDIDKELLFYSIKNAKATSLRRFMNELGIKTGLNREINSWIYGKNLAKHYEIEYLNGKIDLATNNYHLDDMEGSAYASELEVYFQKKIAPVKIEKAHVKLKNSNLIIEPKNGYYKEKNLFGSYVVINHLFGNKEANIIIDLKTDGTLDDDILEIVKSYHINLPVKQLSGISKSHLILNLNLSNLHLRANGSFELYDSELLLGGAKFKSQKTTVFLENSTNIYVKDSDLSMDIFNATANGKIDAQKKEGEFDLKFKNISIKDGDFSILQADNINSKLTIDFKKDIEINLAALGMKLFIDKISTIKIDSLSTILPYSALLKSLNFKDGKLTITSSDFKKLDVAIDEAKFKFPFLQTKSGKSYEQDDIKVAIADKSVILKTKSNYLSFDVQNGQKSLFLKDIDFVFAKSEKGSFSSLNLAVAGENSNIILKDLNKTLILSSYQGKIDGKDINMTAKLNDSNIKFWLNEAKFEVLANNISGKSANLFIGSNMFDGGLLNFKIVGESFEKFKGSIDIRNSYLKQYKYYQQLLSFLDSIPAIIKLKGADFNNKGFSIKHGEVFFEKNGGILEIKAINLKGTSADVGGLGTIDFDKNNIDVKLEIRYLKDASSIIKNIPLLNQIILGKDRKISTIVQIYGTLEEPQYKTNVGVDLINTPFNLMKNIIELPANIF
ncbi:AsmA-like C-terminal domain-containing protein [uncultured Campylobacter sp.]|uniref:YhdP family protein n=1 Tax=uncultured Campylobacter sp. TaxID=218934 RepID=UPI002601FE7F|nr:AsmA-like C-terminal domain-containing protein [uncultured Campylobacter sp.]